MKVVLAVRTAGGTATAAAVAFDDWAAAEPERTHTLSFPAGEPPARGAPDLRGLPCVLELLRRQIPAVALIVVDAPVFLDTADTPGFGRHLHDALGGTVPVVGIARTVGPDTPPTWCVFREDEAPPVAVTAVGLDLGAAKARVRTMHGKRRLPTLLKLAARLAKAEAV